MEDQPNELSPGTASDPPDPHGFGEAARARAPMQETEFTRWRCRRCGAVVPAREVALVGDAHVHGGSRCGPVVEQTARTHHEFVEWLFEAARR
jgi:hypothetical protein